VEEMRVSGWAGWRRCGSAAGPGGGEEKILFSEIILNAKTIPENLEFVLKA
jgi:hypothetical protein